MIGLGTFRSLARVQCLLCFRTSNDLMIESEPIRSCDPPVLSNQIDERYSKLYVFDQLRRMTLDKGLVLNRLSIL